MRGSHYHFFPLALPFLLGLLLIGSLVIALVEVRILGYAYEKIGIAHRHVFALLLLSLLGSYVNIPIAELRAETMHSGHEVGFFGMRYVVPSVENWPRTIVAINVGGAVIPVLLSLYLLAQTRMFSSAIACVAIVTAIVHAIARPVPGLGIAVPTLLPPLVSAAAASLLARQHAPAVAYIAGSLGTLIGADLLNLHRIQGLGAPIASIGGAGTFDGIFLTGILAVLLAGR